MHPHGLLVGALLIASTAVWSPHAAAQQAAPTHPADIRSGSCASPGEVVANLTPLAVPEGETQGPNGATPVAQSSTSISLLVPDMLGATYALMVQMSPEQAETPLVCGEIGGVVGEDGSLTIGLQAMTEGKVSGTASFAPARKGDGTTVTVYLMDERQNRQRDDGGNGETAGNATDSGDGQSEGADGAGAADGNGNVESPDGSDEPLTADDIARLNPNATVEGLPGIDRQPGSDGAVDHPGRPDVGNTRRDRKDRGGHNGNGPARAGEDGKSSADK